ncbi:hypothetical protein COU88_03650 [Candidatus Roizmanbacteria bacterium CG10_big_fil_rev_8_21_14_0_10_39_6]|uniref:Uncharacterized protein n=1 Tax=Candidatus Roizmanbacteria bacterium CG10_big_fil_rev_8_21_14_0_10_39_6 TaxID=1974853 RepID=A0A2M8KRX6_9BACT|nr:MAG: hypothetical protein COU88_03650 [Candidatus Roizmanbacteria bacterium CG10_big_fil_rev_8_21_14_0_10_39_6]
MEEVLYEQRTPIEALKLATFPTPELQALETKYRTVGDAFKVVTPHGGGVPTTYENPAPGTLILAKKHQAETWGPYLMQVVMGGQRAFDADAPLKTQVLDSVVDTFDRLPFYSDMLNGLNLAEKRQVFEKFFNSAKYLDKLKSKLAAVPAGTVESLDREANLARVALTKAQAELAGLPPGDPAIAAKQIEVNNLDTGLAMKLSARDTLPSRVSSALVGAPRDAILEFISDNIDDVNNTIRTETSAATTAIEAGARSDMGKLPTIWRREIVNAESGVREQVVDQKIMTKLVRAYIKRGSDGLLEAMLDRSSANLQQLADFKSANPDEYRKLVVETEALFLADYLRPVAGQHVGTDVVKGYGGKLKKRAIKKIMNSTDPLKTQVLYMAVNNVRNPQTAMLAQELGMEDMVDYMKKTPLSKLKLPEKFKKLFTTKKGLILLASALGIAGGVWYWWYPITHALSAAGSGIAGAYGTVSASVGTMGAKAGLAADTAGRALFGAPLTISPTGITLPQQGFVDTAVQGTKEFIMGPNGLVDRAQEIIANIAASRP